MSGWVLKDWIPDATDPGDLSSYSSFTEKTKVDLDVIVNGGMLTTGAIYAGGQTAQYEVFHAGNFTDNTQAWDTAYGWGNHASAGYLTSLSGAVLTSGNQTMTGGLTISGSVDSGGTDYGYYQSAGTNIVLKGDSVGRSGIFFESEKNGANINDPSDYGFIQFHSYGYGNTSGEANNLVIGVANDSTDKVILQTPYNGGVMVGYRDATSGTGLTLSEVIHSNASSYNNGNWDTAYGWGNHASAGYATTSSTVDKANGLAEVGYGTDEGTFWQSNSSFAGYTGGWANYFIGNHGNGSNYYNTVHIMPFWGPPKYSRLESNTLRGPFNYLTDEIDTVTSKYLQSNSSLRAPIFYDSNDTSYYINPNGTSKLSTIQNVKIENIGKSPIGTGYGSGKLLGYNAINSSGRAAATLGVNEQGYVMEYEKIFTFKVEGNGWVNRSSNPYKLIQAPGTDKMIVVDEFLVYIDYATRTGIGSSGIGYAYEQAVYSVGFYLNETGQSISTANNGVSGTFYTAGIMPGGFMNTSLDRGYYRDVPVHQSALIANRSLFFKTSRNCSSSSNAPGGAHYIKIKYRIIDISEEFNAAGCNQTINVSGYHGQYAHNADGQKQYNDSGNPVF